MEHDRSCKIATPKQDADKMAPQDRGDDFLTVAMIMIGFLSFEFIGAIIYLFKGNVNR